MPRPLYPWEREPVTIVEEAGTRYSDRPAGSESLYRLSYRGSRKRMETEKKVIYFLFQTHKHGIYKQTDKQMLKAFSCNVNRDSARLPGNVTEPDYRKMITKLNNWYIYSPSTKFWDWLCRANTTRAIRRSPTETHRSKSRHVVCLVLSEW